MNFNALLCNSFIYFTAFLTDPWCFLWTAYGHVCMPILVYPPHKRFFKDASVQPLTDSTFDKWSVIICCSRVSGLLEIPMQIFQVLNKFCFYFRKRPRNSFFSFSSFRFCHLRIMKAFKEMALLNCSQLWAMNIFDWNLQNWKLVSWFYFFLPGSELSVISMRIFIPLLI